MPDTEEPKFEVKCKTCNHDRQDHEVGRWQCNIEGCDCKRFRMSQISIPKKPREDLPEKYQIRQGEIITFACYNCGHYETGPWLGLDIGDIAGEDYTLEEHYYTQCPACDQTLSITKCMDLGTIARGIITIEDMQRNPNLPGKIRRCLGNKIPEEI